MAMNGLGGGRTRGLWCVRGRRNPGAAPATHPLIGTRTRIPRMAAEVTASALCL